MMIDATSCPGGPLGPELGGAHHLADAKTLASTSAFNLAKTTPGQAAETRQQRVDHDYGKHARALDALIHDTAPGDRGPVERSLREYGHNGTVLGPVIGVYGGGSSDLGRIRDLAAYELARKHLEYRNMALPDTVALFKRLP